MRAESMTVTAAEDSSSVCSVRDAVTTIVSRVLASAGAAGCASAAGSGSQTPAQARSGAQARVGNDLGISRSSSRTAAPVPLRS
jgi:hypothetical protein